ncbi:MAG: tRNA (adenosine(37)-N6)-threonylcarbamoyltransferase complex dimerization subunit type 1 TsaB [Deltaproteobacteria bacterium]|nr:tRNA (adenosine(37)-N6)-threonylcarbamoyltransferase complex dimerization subunit type 1 TsaB [Deltaproteobacteria bacterium]MBT8359301.1 tRNA (adenosine(37)-N6)-threonylcarbamoyltransferase complex dimerization subunit type 1 TsaB [Deltaproteobacteria bacterium]NNL42729.1 tRNA (adenosine(37)-N6)-threonylcarbamoyltransferase complex dimerization subunit type 1 TsaB [Desulfobacterales bacterium]
MKILAVDTATKSCSVAIVDKESIIAEMTVINEETHSKHLLGIINVVLKYADLDMADLNGFAVTSGPGSFTGLRIGISTIKGFAAALKKPMVGISTLSALASQVFFCPYLICSLIDARKNEVYLAKYRYNDLNLEKEGNELVVSPKVALDEIDEPCMFVGSGAVLYRKTIAEKLGEYAYFAKNHENTIRGSTVARLSMDRFENNDTNDVETFVPNYIRKSDAQLKLKK